MLTVAIYKACLVANFVAKYGFFTSSKLLTKSTTISFCIAMDLVASMSVVFGTVENNRIRGEIAHSKN
jgi:purine-cytosine permease-like protein